MVEAQTARDTLTVPHTTVRYMRKGQEVGHGSLADNFSSPLVSFEDLAIWEINCDATHLPNCKDIPCDFAHKALKMRWNDTSQKLGKLDCSGVEGEKRSIPTTSVIKLQTWTLQNHHTNHCSKLQHAHGVTQKRWLNCIQLFDDSVYIKWSRAVSFEYFILFSSCGTNISPLDFGIQLVRYHVEEAQRLHHVHSLTERTPTTAATKNRLPNDHWLVSSHQLRCRTSSAHRLYLQTSYKHDKWKVLMVNYLLPRLAY